MRALDLFCGAGGASMGLWQAGFEVTGIDISLQRNYPFQFIQADALLVDVDFMRHFDLIWASPPCQDYSTLKYLHKDSFYPRLIIPVREMLRRSGVPYIIENVIGARCEMINPFMLCGSMFNLRVYRHRLFETNFWFMIPPHFSHRDNLQGPGKGMSKKGFVTVTGHGGLGFPDSHNYAKKAMGIDWMTCKQLSQAIPPSYSKFIGEQFLMQK